MNRVIQYVQSVGDLILWLFACGVALVGFIIIVERGMSDAFAFELGISGPGLTKISNYLAIFAFLLVCVSVYLERIPRRPPSHITLVFTAPLMLLLGLSLLALQFKSGGLDPRYIDGCTLLALGGALFRIRGVPIQIFFPA